MDDSKLFDKKYDEYLLLIKNFEFSKKAGILGIQKQDQSFDLSVRFRALHRVPVIFNFNDKDELMPAKAMFLYHDDAQTYLDLECLAITCTYLTGLLIQAGQACPKI